MKAELLKTTGEIIPISPAKPPYFSLEELQRFVGGYIEMYHLHSEPGDLVIVINEEGRIIPLPINDIATVRAFDIEGPLYGDVAFIPRSMIE